MSKNIQSLILGAIVVLAVAVIGLYWGETPKNIGQAVSSTVGVGGTPSGFTEISLADGEVTKGARELKMAAGTSTMIYENRSGDDLLISNPIFALPSDTGAGPLSSYVWVLATTTLGDDLTDESGTAISLTADRILMSWLTATGTGATSTSAAFLRNNHSSISAATQTNGGGRSRDFPIVLQNNSTMVLRLYALANITSDAGQGSGGGVTAATATTRGFNPILKFDYETLD